jgi:chorismate mutase
VKPRVFFICGSLNQTTQLHAVSRALDTRLGGIDARFAPYYGDVIIDGMRRLGLIEMSIAGQKRRRWCLDYLSSHGLPIDIAGKRGRYDLVVTCTDLVIPENVRQYPIVVVQEGILDPEGWVAWVTRHTPLPGWLAGTTRTGESGRFDRYCVASEGYRHHFVSRGADPAKVVATGIPNFDDCKRFERNDFPYKGYVLAATSDTRETMKLLDDRGHFVERVARIARRRGISRILFKLHPNEDEARETREIKRIIPDALVFQKGSAEEMVANCDVLATEWSSVAFVGVALGKEVHSNFSREELSRLCPVQNGGASAANIARVCEELLAPPLVGRARERGQERPPEGFDGARA